MFVRDKDLNVPLGQASAGPRAGPLEAFNAAFEDQALNNSTFGAVNRLRELEDENRSLIKKLTGKDIPQSQRPFDALGFDDTTSPIGALVAPTPERRKAALEESKSLHEQVEQIKLQFPEIKTYKEMVEQVRNEARKTEKRATDVDRRSGFLADTAGFVGGMAGSFTLNDPLNIISLGFAGGGRTLATRVLSEAGFNSAVEGVNQFMGVTGNRRLLGLEFTTEQKLINTVFAGAGAGAIRLGGEGIAAGIRKLAEKTAGGTPATKADIQQALRSEPTPGTSNRAAQLGLEQELAVRDMAPFGKSRSAQAVHEAIFARTYKQINEPWDLTELHAPSSTTIRQEFDFIDQALRDRGIVEEDIISQAQKTFSDLKSIPNDINQARILALREQEPAIREELTAQASQKLPEQDVKKLRSDRSKLKAEVTAARKKATSPEKGQTKAAGKDVADLQKRLDNVEARLAKHSEGAKAETALKQLDQKKFPKQYKPALENRAKELLSVADNLVRGQADAGRGYSAKEAIETVDEIETKINDDLDNIVEAQYQTALRSIDEETGKADFGLETEVDLDMKIKTVDDQGNVTGEMTVREALENLKADDDLIKVIKGC